MVMSVENSLLHFFECICGHDAHTLRLVLDYEEREAYVCLYLSSHLPFWKRLILGIKYILALKQHGSTHFDEFILDRENTDRLERILHRFNIICKYKESKEKNKNKKGE